MKTILRAFMIMALILGVGFVSYLALGIGGLRIPILACALFVLSYAIAVLIET